jgi:hypothetical protein
MENHHFLLVNQPMIINEFFYFFPIAMSNCQRVFRDNITSLIMWDNEGVRVMVLHEMLNHA